MRSNNNSINPHKFTINNNHLDQPRLTNPKIAPPTLRKGLTVGHPVQETTIQHMKRKDTEWNNGNVGAHCVVDITSYYKINNIKGWHEKKTY